MMRRLSRTKLLPLLLPLLLPGLVACMKEPEDPGLRSERVVILLESPPRELDPRFVSDASATKVSKLIFCSLVSFETEDLAPRFDAAEDVYPDCPGEVEDCDHWVVKVRGGVYWHDGMELSADDVRYTFESILRSEHSSVFRADLQRQISDIVVDEDRVHFYLTEPMATFVSNLSIGLVPAHVLEPRGGHSARFGDELVGCGPFRLLYRHGNQKIVLERNEIYWKPVHPRYVVVRTIQDEATRVLSIMAGSGDIVVNGLSPPIVRRLEENSEVQVYHEPSASVTYLSFNLLHESLRDVRVRQAIAHALDREALVHEQFKDMAYVAHGILPPLHWAYEDDVRKYEFDPERASRLLRAAGLGMDPETGARVELTLKVTTDRFRKNIGELIAHQLGQVGIRVTLVPLELSTFLSDVRKGNYEMYVLQLPQVIDPDILRWLLHSRAAPVSIPQAGAGPFGAADRRFLPPEFENVAGPYESLCRARWFPLIARRALENYARFAFGLPTAQGSGNRSFFFDPTLDCMLDLGVATMDRDRRMDFYREAQRIFAQNIPVLPLWHEDNVAVVRTEVEGYSLLPLNRFSPVAGVTLRGR